MGGGSLSFRGNWTAGGNGEINGRYLIVGGQGLKGILQGRIKVKKACVHANWEGQ